MQNHEMVNTPIAPELAQMMDTVAQAAANKSTLYIQGNGSKAHLAGFQPSAHAVLDTRSYSGIVSHLPSELYITVNAGTPVREVDAALAQHGQYLAFEPPFAHYATVGGVVASDARGLSFYRPQALVVTPDLPPARPLQAASRHAVVSRLGFGGGFPRSRAFRPPE